MSKIAEKKALEKYPIKEEWVGNQYGGLEDINSLSREKYQEGYDQAMQDMVKDSDYLKYLSDEVGYAYACGCRKTMQDFLDKAEKFFNEEFFTRFSGKEYRVASNKCMNLQQFIEDFQNYMQDESEKQ